MPFEERYKQTPEVPDQALKSLSRECKSNLVRTRIACSSQNPPCVVQAPQIFRLRPHKLFSQQLAESTCLAKRHVFYLLPFVLLFSSSDEYQFLSPRQQYLSWQKGYYAWMETSRLQPALPG